MRSIGATRAGSAVSKRGIPVRRRICASSWCNALARHATCRRSTQLEGLEIGTLRPNRATVLMTLLRAAPEAAFGSQNVVEVPVDDAGLASVQRNLRTSLETDADGAPRRLADGPYTELRSL
ncbi:MAG TPA: hypothetical protein VJU59_37750 [Paraburkholderia sp.]|jgi:hypothetical protein|uniref:hypothetical protein n=1 Tax=Paraburkholderia sp. TaxID=1926495 RepID=UPI002B477BA8|nr:hypothetical protein [Paraburkholderia sp.]HKR45355.1 hypothetical protein [Paraburkholderia sp.]